jgi:hypothetical protein
VRHRASDGGKSGVETGKERIMDIQVFFNRTEAEVFAKAWRQTVTEQANKEGRPARDCAVEEVPGGISWAVVELFPPG